MSVTPDFIGQVYKDTNTGNIWRANSLAPGDWTLEVQNMQTKWTPHTLKLGQGAGLYLSGDIAGLTSVVFEGSTLLGGVYCAVNNNITSLTAPSLVSVDPTAVTYANVSIQYNPSLSSCDLSALQTIGVVGSGGEFLWAGNACASLDLGSLLNIGYKLDISNDTTLTTVDLSSLQTIGNLINLASLSALTSIDFSSLLSVGNNIVCDTVPSITSLSFPSLQSVTGILQIKSNTLLTSISCPLTVSLGSIEITGNPALTTIDISSLATPFLGTVDCRNNALNTSTVDDILAQLVSIPAWGGTGETVNLSGGTNSAPTSTAPGSDYATLVARGASVTTN